MPKPTKAELLQRFSLATISNTAEGPVAIKLSDKKDMLKPKIVKESVRGSGSGASGVSDPVSSGEASPSPVAKLEVHPTSSHPSCPHVSFSSSDALSSPHETCGRSSSDDHDSSGWSDFEPADAAYAPMCTPREAKALSVATGRFYIVTTLGRDGLVPGDEPQVDGMILHGYTSGKPIYYKYSGVHADLKAIETETVFGLQYIRQPIESCFGHFRQDVDEDSGYGSLQENESIVDAGLEVPPNRVFRNEWFKVGKSKLGGYGVFALKDIDPCITVLLEQPFLCLRDYNTLRQQYEKLKPEERLVFDGLHAFAKNQSDELMQRANANSFMYGGGEAIFAIASNFNHACRMKRNTQYHWDPWRQVMVFTTDSHINKGEELVISYGEGRMVLQEKFGFLCNCGTCEGPMSWTVDQYM